MMKFLMKVLLASLTVVTTAAWAQHALTPPQVGFIQDALGQIYIVKGLAGNFLVSVAVSSGIVSAAYSGSFGLLKADSTLIVVDQQGHGVASVRAPAGPALFAFAADGSPALAYFEQSKTLDVWDGHTFQTSGPMEAQAPLAIASVSPTRAAFIVLREDGLWEYGVELATGAIVSRTALPGVTVPLLMVAGSVVYRDAKGVVVRSKDGSERHIAADLPLNLAFGQMGNGWVQVTDLATNHLFAASIQPGHEAYYLLPEKRQ
jgi:hypothetical protein